MRTLLFDLESTSLSAIMGRILCGSFAWMTVNAKGEAKVGKPYTLSIKDYPGVDAIDDGHLAFEIKEELEQADVICGWNSKLFDVPLLNARLAKKGHAPYRPALHLDLMWYAGGSSLRIGSRKLDNVSKYFDVADRKTELKWETWQLAGAGDSDALKEVIKHCEADVKVLGQVYPHLIPYVRTVHR